GGASFVAKGPGGPPARDLGSGPSAASASVAAAAAAGGVEAADRALAHLGRVRLRRRELARAAELHVRLRQALALPGLDGGAPARREQREDGGGPGDHSRPWMTCSSRCASPARKPACTCRTMPCRSIT